MAPSGIKRVKGVQVFRPFVYGTVARPVPPEKRGANFPPDHTHRWTVFVRGIQDADLTYFIKKVQFRLHETYSNRIRNVEGPPFEVTETGWGEFEIQIKIYFVAESNEKPVTLFHFLKIRQYAGLEGTAEEQLAQQNANPDPVWSVQYEEMVFNEPTEAFYEILQKNGDAKLPQTSGGGRKGEPKNPGQPFSREMENEELDRLQLAIRKVNEQIKLKKDAIVAKEIEVVELRKKREEKEAEKAKRDAEAEEKEEEEGEGKEE